MLRVQPVVRPSRTVLTLGQLKVGESVGEMSLLDPCKASATVKAEGKCRVLEISREQFENFTQENLEAGLRLMRGLGVHLARRVRKASEKMIRQAESAVPSYDWDY